MMKTQTELRYLKKHLQDEGIDTSNFDNLLSEFMKNFDENREKKWNSSCIVPITCKQFQRIIEALSYFKDYFTHEQFSILVIRKMLRFSCIHSMFLTSYPSEKVYVGEYATPCKQLPSDLVVQCSTNGVITVNRRVVQF